MNGISNQIVILGRISSKKNSKMAIPIGKRCVLVTSKAYREWHELASWQLKGKKEIPTPCKLQIEFWFPDHRRTDTQNKAESLLDCLVDNGILPDDNCEVIPELLLIYRGVDKLEPRATIKWETLNTKV